MVQTCLATEKQYLLYDLSILDPDFRFRDGDEFQLVHEALPGHELVLEAFVANERPPFHKFFADPHTFSVIADDEGDNEIHPEQLQRRHNKSKKRKKLSPAGGRTGSREANSRSRSSSPARGPSKKDKGKGRLLDDDEDAPRFDDLPIYQAHDPSRVKDKGQHLSPSDRRNSHGLVDAKWGVGGATGRDPNNPKIGMIVLDGDPNLSGTDAAQLQGALQAGQKPILHKDHTVSTQDKNRLLTKLKKVENATKAQERVNAQRIKEGKEPRNQGVPMNRGEALPRLHGLQPQDGLEDLRSYAGVESGASNHSGNMEGRWRKSINNPDGPPAKEVRFKAQNVQPTKENLEIVHRTEQAFRNHDESLIVSGARHGPNDRT